ncbi:MAG: hypothetical protein QHH80_05235 [Anaerolineae bacterium]|nr:hypothetical protein [Anaerolineae bacterium]
MLQRSARAGIRLIDYFVRRSLGVVEFTNDPDCILRISPARAAQARTLSDGTVIRPGDPLCEIHLWNERLPKMGPDGPDLQWGLAMYRGMVRSLELLARFLQTSAEYADAVAVHAEGAAMRGPEADQVQRLFARLGFDTAPRHAVTRRERFARWWQKLYSTWLIWTFNPASLKGKRMSGLTHCEFWISRRAFMERYGRASG